MKDDDVHFGNELSTYSFIYLFVIDVWLILDKLLIIETGIKLNRNMRPGKKVHVVFFYFLFLLLSVFTYFADFPVKGHLMNHLKAFLSTYCFAFIHSNTTPLLPTRSSLSHYFSRIFIPEAKRVLTFSPLRKVC